VNYCLGNVENLDSLAIEGKFEIVLAGSIIEHLSNPGKMLSGNSTFLRGEGVLIIVTLNVFGLSQFIRVLLMRREAVNRDHTCWFFFQTLG